MTTHQEQMPNDASEAPHECDGDHGPMITLSVQVPEWLLKSTAEILAEDLADLGEGLTGVAEEKREIARRHLYVDAQVMMDMRTDAEKAFQELRRTLPEGDICIDCATDAKLVEAEENMLGSRGCAMTACFVSELADYSDEFADMLVSMVEDTSAVTRAA
ncbi:hypothetical protein [Streptomyces sp. NPDC059411]|uniref:hypothetical protein n=1 Tax=Streptomyces sp. NPDC059411 TaxID=3346825 RepID=UPI0036B4A740